MNQQPAVYVQLEPGSNPPDISMPDPARVVVIVEAEVTPEWQSVVSEWLVRSNCLYMLAWGIKCSEWDDSVDMANIEQFGFGEIPKNQFVITTWHQDQTLPEVFSFAKHWARHPTTDLKRTVLLHISATNKEHELLGTYAAA